MDTLADPLLCCFSCTGSHSLIKLQKCFYQTQFPSLPALKSYLVNLFMRIKKVPSTSLYRLLILNNLKMMEQISLSLFLSHKHADLYLLPHYSTLTIWQALLMIISPYKIYGHGGDL